MYSLVMRTREQRDEGTNLKNIRSLIVAQVPSLVQFWKIKKEDETESISSKITAPTEVKIPSIEQNGNANSHAIQFLEEAKFTREVFLQRDSVFTNLRVKGDLQVVSFGVLANIFRYKCHV